MTMSPRLVPAVYSTRTGQVHGVASVSVSPKGTEWAVAIMEYATHARANTPEGRLLAIFDVFGDWARRDDFEARRFLSVALERVHLRPGSSSSRDMRGLVGGLAAEAGLTAPNDFCNSMHVLMSGLIAGAANGDAGAARRAQEMATDLIARHRPTAQVRPMPTSSVEQFDMDEFELGMIDPDVEYSAPPVAVRSFDYAAVFDYYTL